MASSILVAVYISCMVLLYFSGLAAAGVHFSSLKNTLRVTATIRSHNSSTTNVAKAGSDDVEVTWALEGSLPAGTDEVYKKVKVKLCFAPTSQVDRAWRKTKDDLKKDKTCQFDITQQPYSSSSSAIANRTVTWTVEKDVPGGSYFVRAYALDASGAEVAYGQTTNRNKTSNLLVVEPISGRHVSLDIATACFSVFSVVALLGFFVAEKMGANKAQKK
eukprot:Gb_07111 [translate_table: standard]